MMIAGDAATVRRFGSSRYFAVPVVLALAAAFWAAPAHAQELRQLRDEVHTELLDAAELGEPPRALLRHVRLNNPDAGDQTASVAQAYWRTGEPHPRIVRVELVRQGSAWVVTSRRDALMHRITFDRLARNVLGAATVMVDSDRGVSWCSHGFDGRLELRLPNQGDLVLSRSVHCRPDLPLAVAGELLRSAVEDGL